VEINPAASFIFQKIEFCIPKEIVQNDLISAIYTYYRKICLRNGAAENARKMLLNL
jgi:hypothetical protein